MNTSTLNLLSKIELGLGLIGGGAAAYITGLQLDGYKFVRNWPLTIGVFIGSSLFAIIIYAILAGIVMVLNNQKSIIDKLDNQSLKEKHAEAGAWKCPRCGKINDAVVGTCGCGARRPG